MFIDNMSLIHILCNGAAKHHDVGSLAHALHNRLCTLSSNPWFEHIESWSNPADGGSRVGVCCPTAARLGIPLMLVEPIAIPSSFPWLFPCDLEALWRT